MKDAAWFYRLLIGLYPRSYRQAFGPEMLQTFLDWRQDHRRANGHVGLRTWFPMLTDEVRNIAAQRAAALGQWSPLKSASLTIVFPLLLLFIPAAGISTPSRRTHVLDRSSKTTGAPHQTETPARLGTKTVPDSLRPLPVEALAGMNAPTGWGIGSLSPDGRWFVYALREGARLRGKGVDGEDRLPTGLSSSRNAGTNLFLVDTRTGRQERITDDVGRYEQPLWSPDGRYVAFYSDRDGVGRVWVWDATARRLRKLADARVHPSSFAHLKWTPDSKMVVVLLEPDRPGGTPPAKRIEAAAPRLTDSTVAPGATAKVYRTALRKDSVARTAVGVDTTTMDTASLWGHMNADLATVRVTDGAVRRLALNRPLFWYDVSPDGRWIALSHQSAIIKAAGQAMYDYEVVPVTGGDVRTVARRGRAGYGTASWSPDGKTLAYVAVGPMARGDIFLADVEAGRERQLTTAPHPPLMAEDATPFWSLDGRALYMALQGQVWLASIDGNALTAVTPEHWDRSVTGIVTDAAGNRIHSTDGGATFLVATIDPVTKNGGFYRLDATTRTATKLREEPRRFAASRRTVAQVSTDGSTIAYLAEDGEHPPDVWGGSSDLANPRQLTTLNPAISSASLGRTEVIDYIGTRGQPLQAVLLYPGNYERGKRYPLIVRVYPGPFKFADNVHRFGLDGPSGIWNMQMYASRGYAVLMPEIPQELGTPMRDLTEGVNAAVNKVIEMGVADPGRLGVTGQSYGGYSTIAIVTQTTRFKGAIMSSGFGNMIDQALRFRPASGADASYWTEGGQGLMGGTLWEQKERYLTNSPVLYLDRVRTPVLIISGEDDDTVPVVMGDQIFVGLRRLGREVEYRRYAGEGHVISSSENVIDYWRAAIRWFDTYVKNAPTAVSQRTTG